MEDLLLEETNATHESVPENTTHESVLKKWAEWIELQGFAKGSVKDHHQKLKPFLVFIEDGDPLEVTHKTLANYQTHLFEAESEKTGKRLACNSQINRLTALKNFYCFLHQTGRIPTNPAEKLTLPRHPKLLPPVLLKPAEMRKLLDAPDLGNPLGFRDRTIMEVFYATGMRLSELTSLAVKDLDFAQELVLIRQGKGQKDRLVPMGESAKSWLTEYLTNVRPLLKGKTTNTTHESVLDTVFVNRFARPLQKSGWQKKLPEYLKRAGIKKPFTSHCFRHQLATAMLEKGADTRHIQEILGHETLKTTQRYLHVVKAELKRIHGKTHPREKNYVGGI